MSADFHQVMYDDMGVVVQSAQGRMAWQRPDHFYWSITSPEKQLIVADGRWVWQHNPALAQTTRQPLRHQMGTPMALLSGEVSQLGAQFDVRQAGTGDYILKPKDPDAPFTQIQLTFKAGQLQGMAFEDTLAQRTVFTFSNVKLNAKLPAGMFVFKEK